MSVRESWRRYEDWRIRQCVRGRGAGDLLAALLLVPSGAWILSRVALAEEGDVAASTLFVGAILFALGWSSLGRAFWSRIVARLASSSRT